MALSKDCQDKLKGNEEYNYIKIFYRNRTDKIKKKILKGEKVHPGLAFRKSQEYLIKAYSMERILS